MRIRSLFASALRDPTSAIGVALTTASAVVFAFLFALEASGSLRNPYAGIVVFLMVPAIFILGLLLIPIGLYYERRRARLGESRKTLPRIDLNDPGTRRLGLFLVAATLVNLLIVSMASYGAVEYTESPSFCGQVCHEPMEPQRVAHQAGLHGRVPCAACHVGPGAGGFIEAKMSGTRKFVHTVTGNFPRPISTALESLPAVTNSCENCHQPDRFIGDVIKVVYDHREDEANTETAETLRIHVGGPIGGTGAGIGIHWHMNRSNRVEFLASDDHYEKIQYVRVSTPNGQIREYFAEGVTPGDVQGKPRRRMDCLDCHSRPAHRFAASAEREVDAAMGAGEISRRIPFIRRDAVRALKGSYPSQEVATRQIERAIRDGVNAGQQRGFNEADVRQAVEVTQAIYRTNIFPSMKVGWGTYPDQLGHMTSTGCFRCHDDSHKTKEGVAISQDCELCHAIE
jgi:hypothetical protein